MKDIKQIMNIYNLANNIIKRTYAAIGRGVKPIITKTASTIDLNILTRRNKMKEQQLIPGDYTGYEINQVGPITTDYPGIGCPFDEEETKGSLITVTPDLIKIKKALTGIS